MKKWAIPAIALLAIAGGFAAWRFDLLNWQKHPPIVEPKGAEPDPRLTYKGPFLNVHPKVQYVGDAACADCHEDHIAKFRTHPMGQSLSPIADAKEVGIFGTKHHNPFQAFDSRFRLEATKDGVVHRQERLDKDGKVIWDLAFNVDYVVGSGVHGKSYMSNRGGFLFMSPVSWYAGKKNIWDLSPGFARSILSGRPVVHECLFCHANRSAPRHDTIFGYDKKKVFHGHTIGCERCHGPGELHVEKRSEQWDPDWKTIEPSDFLDTDAKHPRKADFTIVNPRHLTSHLRDAVCEQCHLEGARIVRRGRELYDFRPGLPLESCWSIFVDSRHSGEERKVVNHVEQMHLSTCWQRSSGANKLGCISCHDPHQRPAAKIQATFYREKCSKCHTGDSDKADARYTHGCSKSLKERLTINKDNCVACHMPKFRPEELSHGAFTDHRILRTPFSKPARHPHRDDSGYPITHFHVGAKALDDSGYARDFALGLFHISMDQNIETRHILRGISILDKAVEEYPEDWPAWEALGDLHQLLPEDKETLVTALSYYRQVIKHRPHREKSLSRAATILLKLRRANESEPMWRKLITINKWEPSYHQNLAIVCAGKGDWKGAAKHCADSLAVSPNDTIRRKYLIRCLLRSNQHKEAQLELQRVLRMDHEKADENTSWYGALQKSLRGSGDP